MFWCCDFLLSSDAKSINTVSKFLQALPCQTISQCYESFFHLTEIVTLTVLCIFCTFNASWISCWDCVLLVCLEFWLRCCYALKLESIIVAMIIIIMLIIVIILFIHSFIAAICRFCGELSLYLFWLFIPHTRETYTALINVEYSIPFTVLAIEDCHSFAFLFSFCSNEIRQTLCL